VYKRQMCIFSRPVPTEPTLNNVPFAGEWSVVNLQLCFWQKKLIVGYY